MGVSYPGRHCGLEKDRGERKRMDKGNHFFGERGTREKNVSKKRGKNFGGREQADAPVQSGGFAKRVGRKGSKKP